jgi:hypothetical protein
MPGPVGIAILVTLTNGNVVGKRVNDKNSVNVNTKALKALRAGTRGRVPYGKMHVKAGKLFRR